MKWLEKYEWFRALKRDWKGIQEVEPIPYVKEPKEMISVSLNGSYDLYYEEKEETIVNYRHRYHSYSNNNYINHKLKITLTATAKLLINGTHYNVPIVDQNSFLIIGNSRQQVYSLFAEFTKQERDEIIMEGVKNICERTICDHIKELELEDAKKIIDSGRKDINITIEIEKDKII